VGAFLKVGQPKPRAPDDSLELVVEWSSLSATTSPGVRFLRSIQTLTSLAASRLRASDGNGVTIGLRGAQLERCLGRDAASSRTAGGIQPSLRDSPGTMLTVQYMDESEPAAWPIGYVTVASMLTCSVAAARRT
jgi:hypothetical protein